MHQYQTKLGEIFLWETSQWKNAETEREATWPGLFKSGLSAALLNVELRNTSVSCEGDGKRKDLVVFSLFDNALLSYLILEVFMNDVFQMQLFIGRDPFGI